MKKYFFTAVLLASVVVFMSFNRGIITEMGKAIELKNMDTKVLPGDNFYEYVNGNWIKEHPVPPEYSQYGAFTILYEENQKKLRSLIEKVSAEENAP
ncbi:MAG: M13 family metallopeptidase N-terminal domain-containing protein, partial [Gimesia sp.]